MAAWLRCPAADGSVDGLDESGHVTYIIPLAEGQPERRNWRGVVFAGEGLYNDGLCGFRISVSADPKYLFDKDWRRV